METVPFEILIYEDEKGKEPFAEWLNNCDKTTRARVFSRLDRVEQGNMGDYKPISDNIFELRFHFNPGFRVYFGKVKNTVILLLTGGKKSSQKRDIKKARKYWDEFQRREI